MKKVMVLVALFVSLWCNSALAYDVQLNDDYSLHEILAKYNQYCRNNMETQDMFNAIVSESPTRVDMNIMDGTTAYSTSGVQDVIIMAAVNGNGKVSRIVLFSPSSMENIINGLYAVRLMMVIDPRGDRDTIVDKIATAVSTKGVTFYESPTQNRIYEFAHTVTSNGGHMTIIGASVL
jgi:hypothetical protein